MSVNMTARSTSTVPFEGIRIHSVEVQCLGEGQWEAKLRIPGEQLPVSCGNHHPSKSAPIEVALKCACDWHARSQEAFAQWISQTRAELSSD